MWKAFRYTWIVVVLAGIYLGWSFYSQRSEKQEFIKKIEENNPSPDRNISDFYSAELSILNFYAIPQTIRPGDAAELCYGVSNAESVRIEPVVENVWPAYTRCVEISPETDTVYKLIAEDAEGNTETKEAAITVSKD